MSNYAYYNEFNPQAAAWLRELIKQKLIADGEVDERSIVDVEANDIRGFTQCHWFAGIGGWSYSLRLAGIPDDFPVWTASLPCQPFSCAGNQQGKNDDRHLFPHYLELVRQCKPSIQLGEQVEGAIKHGWLDDLYTAMEAEDYAVGSAILGAHSVNAPHIRQRLYWTAISRLSNTKNGNGWRESQCASSDSRESRHEFRGNGSCSDGRMGNTKLHGHNADTFRRSIEQGQAESRMFKLEGSSTDWIKCRDGKHRPIPKGIKPVIPTKPSVKSVVDGLPKGMVHSGDNCNEINANETQEARKIRLHGYGNAICAPLAALFIESVLF